MLQAPAPVLALALAQALASRIQELARRLTATTHPTRRGDSPCCRMQHSCRAGFRPQTLLCCLLCAPCASSKLTEAALACAATPTLALAEACPSTSPALRCARRQNLLSMVCCML